MILALFLLTGCNDGAAITEIGNPELTMAARARTSAPDEVGLGTPATFTVDEAWVVLGDLRFVRADICDSPTETEIDVPGPWIVDTVAAPEVVMVELEADDYCRIRVPLERGRAPLPVGAPEDLEGQIVLIVGRDADDRAIRLATSEELELDVRSRGTPFPIEAGQQQLLLSFDLAAWLDGVPLSEAVEGDDGVVRIDRDNNREVHDVFVGNLERAVELVDDLDEDGDVDDDEAADPLATSEP